MHQLAEVVSRRDRRVIFITRRRRELMKRGDLLGGDAQHQQGIIDFYHHHALALANLAAGAQVKQPAVARLRRKAETAEQPTGQ